MWWMIRSTLDFEHNQAHIYLRNILLLVLACSVKHRHDTIYPFVQKFSDLRLLEDLLQKYDKCEYPEMRNTYFTRMKLKIPFSSLREGKLSVIGSIDELFGWFVIILESRLGKFQWYVCSNSNLRYVSMWCSRRFLNNSRIFI